MVLRRKDLTGQRFNDLVAKKVVGKDDRGCIWECLCDCGKTTTVIATRLIGGKKKSCGCRKLGERHHQWSGTGGITGSTWRKVVNGAKERKFELSITIDQAWELYQKQNGKCALSGVDISLAHDTRDFLTARATASLDRIDSKKGYIQGNVQWVHKDINLMKFDMAEDSFVYWCDKVASHKKIAKARAEPISTSRARWENRRLNETQNSPVKVATS